MKPKTRKEVLEERRRRPSTASSPPISANRPEVEAMPGTYVHVDLDDA